MLDWLLIHWLDILQWTGISITGATIWHQNRTRRQTTQAWDKAHDNLTAAMTLANVTYEWVAHVRGCNVCLTGYPYGVHCDAGVGAYRDVQDASEQVIKVAGITEVRIVVEEEVVEDA